MDSLEKGISIENEHRASLERVIKNKDLVDKIIENIASDHLKEDPNYYEKLERMEQDKDEKKKQLAIAIIEGKRD